MCVKFYGQRIAHLRGQGCEFGETENGGGNSTSKEKEKLKKVETRNNDEDIGEI